MFRVVAAIAAALLIILSQQPAHGAPIPINVRASTSLEECRTYAGGGLAGIACVAAMNGHFYVIVWDYSGQADSFNIYFQSNRGNWQILRPPSPIRPAATGKGVAMLDPAKVGTGVCFAVSQLTGGLEGPRSTPACVGASSQTNFVWPPKNLRTTNSLDECRTYAGGGLAGLACAAAMSGHFYVLVWDVIGGQADGFNVYESAGTNLGRALLGWHLIRPPSPLMALPNGTLVRAAMLDPAKVGTSACFAVTTLSGGHESEQSSSVCVNPGMASTPKQIGIQHTTLVPTHTLSSLVVWVDETGALAGAGGEPTHYESSQQNRTGSVDVGYKYTTTKDSTSGIDVADIYLRRSAIYFDLSALAGDRIRNATLHLHVGNSSVGGPSASNIYPSTPTSCIGKIGFGQTDWWDRPNWMEGSWFQDLGRTSGPAVSVDVTKQVQQWLSGARNYGFVLRGEDENLHAFTEDSCITHYDDVSLDVAYY